MRLVLDVVIPIASAYAVLIGVVLYAVRHSDAGYPPGRPVGWRPRLRLIAVTIGGGYACFLAIVLVFHVWIAEQHGAMTSAILGGAFLAAVCAGAFLIGSAIERIRH